MRAVYEALCTARRRCMMSDSCSVAQGSEIGTVVGNNMQEVSEALNETRQALADSATTAAGENGPKLIKNVKHGGTEYELPGTCDDCVQLRILNY